MTYNERLKLFKLQYEYLQRMFGYFVKSEKEKAIYYSDKALKIDPLNNMNYKEWKDAQYEDFL